MTVSEQIHILHNLPNGSVVEFTRLFHFVEEKRKKPIFDQGDKAILRQHDNRLAGIDTWALIESIDGKLSCWVPYSYLTCDAIKVTEILTDDDDDDDLRTWTFTDD